MSIYEYNEEEHIRMEREDAFEDGRKAGYDEGRQQERMNTEKERQRAELEKEHAEQERQRAELEKERAEQERQRAELEKEHAEQERQRAELAEAEIKRLHAELKKLK